MKIFRLLTLALLLMSGVFTTLVVAEEGATARPLLIDVRTEPEWKDGHVQGAIRIPYEKIGDEIEKIAPDKKTKINLYCRTGRRSGIALDTLKKFGYEDVTNLIDAKTAAEKLKLPIVTGDK
jgi:phage shock protein E